MPASFSGLAFFVYPVTDMARARTFYGRLLGLAETANWQDQWVEYTVGPAHGPVLALCAALGEDTHPGRAGAAALETADFDGVVAHLRAHEVPIVAGPADSGICHFARFTDPDGNHLVLHRKHAPAGS